MKRALLWFPLALAAGTAAWLAACGGDAGSNLFPPDPTRDGGVDPGRDGADEGDAATDATSGGDGGTGDATAGDAADAKAGDAKADAPSCRGLECQRPQCDAGRATTIFGRVLDPAKKNPVYNAMVYVPNAAVAPLVSGPTCRACGTPPSGEPIALALTASDGSFQLADVPAGRDIPLVIQIGQWRRQVTLPSVAACAETRPDQDLLRLPRNSTEGDIPRIAVVSGGCDRIECTLRKIGLDDSEFTLSTGSGRVHLYTGAGGATLATGTEAATVLWSSPSRLAQYDTVLQGCECKEDPVTKPATSLRNMFDYANAGGRVYGNHYHAYWVRQGPFPFPYTSDMSGLSFSPAAIDVPVDTSFPKGAAYAAWLQATGATSVFGQLPVGEMRYQIKSVRSPALGWLLPPQPDGGAVAEIAQYSFNTPFALPADAGVDAGGYDAGPSALSCGKVVTSDFHVVSGLGSTTSISFPTGCPGGDMLPTEKAFEFTLFDLGTCVQDDRRSPVRPPLR